MCSLTENKFWGCGHIVGHHNAKTRGVRTSWTPTDWHPWCCILQGKTQRILRSVWRTYIHWCVTHNSAATTCVVDIRVLYHEVLRSNWSATTQPCRLPDTSSCNFPWTSASISAKWKSTRQKVGHANTRCSKIELNQSTCYISPRIYRL